ncbi:MAG: YeeE/YedE family protein [Beijerinckiaceae bacterium]
MAMIARLVEAAIESWGEASVLAVAGLMIGVLFGALAQRSRFCLRAAVIEFSRGRLGPKLAVWLLAFATALASAQALIGLGWLDVAQARQLASEGSISGAVIGGLLFGIGMVMTRGCASRLLVLSANGNLRALLSGLVFAMAAQASYRGILAPAREFLARLWTIGGGPMRDLGQLAGWGRWGTLALLTSWILAAIYVARSNRLKPRVWLSAIGVGAVITLGWWATYGIGQAAFAPVALRSITFSGPSADMLMLVLSPAGRTIDFEQGLVPGVVLGSFLMGWMAGELKLEGFKDGHSMRRYIAGAVMAGFGAMLAGGCAVGAGVTGGAILATTAWLTLFSMWLGAGIADHILDARSEAAEPQHGAVPAMPDAATPPHRA